MISSRVKRPTTPTSEAFVAKVVNGYKCLVCSVVCGSEDQLSGHVAGKRHAQNLAFMEARGSQRWRGDPNYSGFNFWNTVSDLVPEYLCLYPSVDALLSTRFLRTSKISVDTDVLSISSPSFYPRDPSIFFSTMYQSRLPSGEYVCELCGDQSISGITNFHHHLNSESHQNSKNAFADIDCDYFQPILNPQTGDIYFVGIVSLSLIMYERYFNEHSVLLFDQWSLIDRQPTQNSCINVLTPDEAMHVFHLVVV